MSSRRVRQQYGVYMVSDNDGDRIDLGVDVIVLYADGYWWTRLCTANGSPLGPWELQTVDQISRWLTRPRVTDGCTA